MSELTKRLRETQDDWPMNLVLLEREAADRIEALEGCLRELLTLYDCNIAWGTATNKARALLESQ